MPFTRTFNEPVSRLVLDHIHAHPEEWNQKFNHCGLVHCYMGLCDKFLGNYKEENGNCIAQKTVNSMGLFYRDYQEITNPRNTLARLEALHLLHSIGVFGVNGRDTNGFDRRRLDIDGLDVDGRDAMGLYRNV